MMSSFNPDTPATAANSMTALHPRKIFSLLVFSLLVFFGGYVVGVQGAASSPVRRFLGVEVERSGPSNTSNGGTVDLSLFWDVWNLLHQEYLRQDLLDPQELLYGAARGLTQALGDPYTAFLSPEENAETKDGLNGQYEGIGAELGMKDERLLIIAPLEGSPAESLGVRAGDFIAEIDGASTAGVSLTEAVSRIRGESGSDVVLKLIRGEGKQAMDLSVTIRRAKITLKSVKWETGDAAAQRLGGNSLPGKGIFYIRLSRFGESTVSEWSTAINEILAVPGGSKGIVLDLRNNPGGLLSAAIQIASDFFGSGLVVSEEFGDGRRQDFPSTGVNRLGGIPTVVLINEGSASASEILAAALKYHVGATLVGSKSFGKGTVQDAQDLRDGAGVHVTVAKWLTPKGECIDGQGITPDVEVAVTESDIVASKDPQLLTALELLVR